MALKKIGSPAAAAAATPAKTGLAAKVAATTAPKAAAAPPAEDKSSVHESKVVVTRTAMAGGVEADPNVEEHVLAVHKFVTTPGHVAVKVGSTRNVGDSNFIKTEVFVSVPHYNEERDAAFEVAQESAMTYLSSVMGNATVDTVFGGGAAGDDTAGQALAEGAQEDAGAEGAAEGDEITPEAIRAMDQDALEALMAANNIEIDMSAIDSVEGLAEAIIAAAFAEEGAEGTVEGGDGEFVPYTEEQLDAMSIAQLKEVCTGWGLDTATIFKGPPPVHKKNAKAAILAAQAG